MYNPYSNLPKELKIFDADALEVVETLSAGLSEEEVLDYFAVTQEQLDESPLDQTIFIAAFKRGKSKAKAEATRLLFRSMADKNGTNAAALYLKTFGAQWADSQLADGKLSVDIALNTKLSREEVQAELKARGLPSSLLDD